MGKNYEPQTNHIDKAGPDILDYQPCPHLLVIFVLLVVGRTEVEERNTQRAYGLTDRQDFGQGARYV